MDFLLDKYTPNNELISFNNGNIHFPLFTLDMNKITISHAMEQNNSKIFSFEENLRTVNSYIKKLYSLLEIKEGQLIPLSSDFAINIISELYSFTMKSLFLILSHPNFTLSRPETDELDIFFNYVIEVRKVAKECAKLLIPDNLNLNKKQIIKEAIIDSFSLINNDANNFSKMVEASQNFLALLLFNIGSAEDENEEEELFDKTLARLLVKFVKSLNILFLTNQKYKLIDEKDFYNDGLSKNLNFKRECNIYNQILSKNYHGHKPFCLISYIWLFDPGAKSDILREFNKKKQDSEVLSSFRNGLGGALNFPPLINVDSIFFYMKVKRDRLIEDTLNIVANSNINLQKPLKVKFIGEQGVDEGGVRKEFFLLLVRQIFDANYGMFTYKENTRLFWFNLFSFEPKIKYELIGIILGLALFNNVILDVKFPLVIYKKLLGCPLTIEDMKDCDPDLYNTLSYLKNAKEENLEEIVYSNFSVTVDKFGEKIEIPLKPNGENIPITNANKDEYVELYLDWYFNKSIEEYFVCFRKGFFRVVDQKLSHLLKPEELELIICGIQELNFIELEKAAHYEDGYNKNSSTVKLFWEVLHSFSEEEKKKFLFFVTGCDRAPINGLGSLEITISRFGPDSDKLPCAHTCFNHLLLPDYNNKEKISKCLRKAISYSEGFGMI